MLWWSPTPLFRMLNSTFFSDSFLGTDQNSRLCPEPLSFTAANRSFLHCWPQNPNHKHSWALQLQVCADFCSLATHSTSRMLKCHSLEVGPGLPRDPSRFIELGQIYVCCFHHQVEESAIFGNSLFDYQLRIVLLRCPQKPTCTRTKLPETAPQVPKIQILIVFLDQSKLKERHQCSLDVFLQTRMVMKTCPRLSTWSPGVSGPPCDVSSVSTMSVL